MEEPFFFDGVGGRLFGVAHAPERDTDRKGFVLIHPFGEEKLWSHRVFVNFAREAALRGIPALRFDLSGHGDSEGHSQNSTVSSYLADIESAQRKFLELFPDTQEPGLLGLRLGATLAYLTSARQGNLSSLILWEPIINGARYMQELLRINLSTQLAVYGSVKENREALVEKMRQGISTNVDGYLISREFFDECTSIDLSQDELVKPGVPSLVVQIAPNIKQKDRQELVVLADSLLEGSFLKIEEPPFWREIKPFSSRAQNLVGATLDYVEGTSGR